MKMVFGKLPEIGFPHHRWFCELVNGELHFFHEGQEVGIDRSCYITRGELGRKMTEAESGIGIFWTGTFTAREIIIGAHESLVEIKRRILGELKAG